MVRVADHGHRLGQEFGDARITSYFATFAASMQMLEQMARAQRAGQPFTPEQMNFVNRIVTIQHGCVVSDSTLQGWYGDLFFDRSLGALEYDPTIADVHTQPTTYAGASVGKVLHVATGRPRVMVVTLDTCQGPRAYEERARARTRERAAPGRGRAGPSWRAARERALAPECRRALAGILPCR